jgi:hypothetical protein
VTEAPRDVVGAIAFYLPQFHPIPENDIWWGAGFTEWTNTAKARPLFPGHRQPTLPADLGFYDLRLPESRAAQADLAAEYGLTAFCYWHYWFGGGRTILDAPFAAVLASGEPALPFCLAWANQSWTGTWHAAPDRMLMEQGYPGPEDDQAHFDALLPALRDNRYLTIGGRPVFYVFRPEQLPDPARFVDLWQSMARKAGLPGLYLVAEVSDLLGRGAAYLRSKEDGFDAGVYLRMPADVGGAADTRMRAGRKLARLPEIYRYAEEPIPLASEIDQRQYHPAVYPNWDNTPRAGRRGLVLHGSSPERFRVHLREAVARARHHPSGEQLVWIKSWNEWAEGNHLEPDLRHGRAWLEVLDEELRGGP